MFFASLRNSLQNLIFIIETPSITVFRVGGSVTHNYTHP